MSTEAVALKLPAFWTSCPEAWFAQAEAQFDIRKISVDSTKYSYVVSALDTDTATRALSILKSPPADDKYDAIKNFLISAYGLSDSERASALFKCAGLGDSKPSELMDKMLALLGTHEPCLLFRHLFMQQLPEFVRTPLATSPETDCRKLALEADKYYASGRQPSLTPLPATSSPAPVSSVESVSQPSSSPRARPPSARVTPSSTVCWFHRRFGSKAKRCLLPCQFASQGNDSGGQR